MDVFKLQGDKLTATSAIKHHIPTPPIPVNTANTLRNYRIPEQHQNEVDNLVQKRLENGIIQQSKSMEFSNFGSSQDIRCIWKTQMAKVLISENNDVTVSDSFPVPNIQDILDKLGRARCLSAPDCSSGYWQVPLAEGDRPKTALSTSTCHYE
jgi:hypothetical protein